MGDSFDDYTEKSALGSKTIQGAVISIAGALLGAYGIPVELGPEVIPHVITILGGLYSIIGRLSASEKITKIFPWF